MCNHTTIVSCYMALLYTYYTTIWVQLAPARFAQNSTKMYTATTSTTIVHIVQNSNCTIVVTSWLVRREWGKSWGFMDYYCAGYWHLSSFHKVVPRFFIPFYSESDSFFLFPRLESVESGLWTLESTYGILRFESNFETGFMISWDWFHICQYWFCFCSHFWRTLNRFWTTKHVPENQISSIYNLLQLWFVIRKFSGKFRVFFISLFL